MRASDADRDQAVERLHRAATEGRIASDEHEQRVTAALRARTYAELDATTADLPGPGRRRELAPRSRSRSAGGYALSAVRTHPALLILAIPIAATAFALMVAATVLWAVWRRSCWCSAATGEGRTHPGRTAGATRMKAGRAPRAGDRTRGIPAGPGADRAGRGRADSLSSSRRARARPGTPPGAPRSGRPASSAACPSSGPPAACACG